MKLSGWGSYPVIDAHIIAPRSIEELTDQIKLGYAIPRGNGRSYGDSAISACNTISMKYFNRMIALDPQNGQLITQSGVILGDIIEAFLPKGWFPAVTPGTKFVTVGGMVAADVHGKNHHKEGSFGNFIDWIEIIKPDGQIERCSKEHNSELFNWTIGGMGLTGVILNVAFRLKLIETSWIQQQTICCDNLKEVMDAFETNMDKTYSVAWIDCLAEGEKLGRSLVMFGEHARPEDLPKENQNTPLEYVKKKKINFPITLPSWVLNGTTVKIFNELYYWNGKRKPKESLVDWDSYFYPLDSILGWNKIYGKKGFAQFQCVIPLDKSYDGLSELLQEISDSGTGSFLAVLKRFGKQQSAFSFPMEGYTLALDFAISDKTLDLMKKLDQITLKYQGRFYLAKDSRMTTSVFQQSDPRAREYFEYRLQQNYREKFVSEQSKRLHL